MAERNITYCVAAIQTAWAEAVAAWDVTYPNAPKPFLTCTYRSRQEQDQMYAKGRSAPGPKVTNAKGGESPHNYNPCLAIDFALKNKDGSANWNPALFIQFWNLFNTNKTKGLFTYGGSWKTLKDYAHIEITNWKNLV